MTMQYPAGRELNALQGPVAVEECISAVHPGQHAQFVAHHVDSPPLQRDALVQRTQRPERRDAPPPPR